MIMIVAIIMILSLIMIDSSLDYFTELPDFEEVDSRELDIDSLTDEIELNNRNISHGFRVIGKSFSVDQDNRIHTYLVDETNLFVGDIVKKGDFLDSAETISSSTVGQIYNIHYFDEQYHVVVYNFENIMLEVSIDLFNFNQLNNFDNIEIILGNNTYFGKLNEIEHYIDNNKINLLIEFADYGSIDFNLVEESTMYIQFEIGILENVLSLPSSYSNLEGRLVYVITDEG
ncbi:MAG: hypothetical protein RBT45_05265, partial [Acholeplasmataceae bacterium]|nr:hypothetical protein [Acholeplasmataceae bacterium]